MRNVIKSQLYQFRKERITKLLFFGLIAIFTLIAFMSIIQAEISETAMIEATGGGYFATNLRFFIFMPLVYVASVVAQICGHDFTDKTANYELMSGRQRYQSYFGRVIPAVIIATIGWLIIVVTPVIIITIVKGWGDKISVWEVVLRYALMIFPTIRVACEFVFFTFLIKNPYIVMGLGYLYSMVSMYAEMMSSDGFLFLGSTNIILLSMVDVWTTYGLEGKLNFIYDAALSSSDIIGTIVISLVVSAAALFLGYIFFKNDDMN